MKTVCYILLLSTIFVMIGCSSSRRPVLYPNAHLNRVGQQQANMDINACMRAAEASGANANRSEELAKDTAKAGAVGATTGAVVGAISSSSNSTGTSAAIGGAGAATATLVKGAFDASEPTPIYMRFVDQCLRDKGYQSLGWQ